MTTPLRVLIVDDDAGARALHSRFVADLPGFVVVGTAGTGEAALASLAKGVDVVLLDMRMPDISGIEVLHRLRTVGDVAPDVLVVSSSNDQVTVRQALAAQVIGYLVKPFTQEALAERLTAYAAERRLRSTSDRDLHLAQGEIDRLLATGTIRTATRTGSATPNSLPKGLSEVTLARVLEALDPVIPVTVAEITTACDLSRATARRYLDHLVTTGLITLAHRYGKRGRPQVLYRLAPGVHE